MVALLRKSKRVCQKCGEPILTKHGRVYCGVVCAGVDPKKEVACIECKAMFLPKSGARFCSRSCAGKLNGRVRSYSHSVETRARIGETNREVFKRKAILDGRVVKSSQPIVRGGKVGLRSLFSKSCEVCLKVFITGRKKTKTCSKNCLKVLRGQISKNNEELARIKGKENIERLMRDGVWKGWSGRGESSYPEKYVAGLLNQAGLDYEKEHRVLRFSIDFAFVSQKIALEVDGKQHHYPKQKAHDQQRDVLLEREGWKIFRLDWKSVKTDEGKQAVHKRFEEFLVFLSY